MRPEERIDIFCKILADEWKRQGSDLRFTQFLINNGINMSNGTSDLYYMEEDDFLQKVFPDIIPAKYYVWGTRGKDGKQPLKFIPIKDLETSHIEAILDDYENKKLRLWGKYVEVFQNELANRKANHEVKFDDGSRQVKLAISALKNLRKSPEKIARYKKMAKKVEKRLDKEKKK